MKKNVLFLILILVALSSPVFSAPSTGKYPHMKLGYYIMYPMTDVQQAWIGTHWDLVVLSGIKTQNLNALYTANPNILLTVYKAGIARWSTPSLSGREAEWDSFQAWCLANGKDFEDAIAHYKYDVQFTTGQPLSTNDWSDHTIVEGFGLGLNPGYPDGTAIARSQSRLLGTPSFYHPATRTLTISAAPIGASRLSNVVTITTTTNHLLEKDDTVRVAGVTNDSFNGVFIITEVPTSTTFKYSKSGGDETSGSGNVYYSGAQMWGTNNGSNVLIDYLTITSTLDSELTSKDGYKANGYFFDSVVNKLFVYAVHRLDKTIEYANSGYSDIVTWITDTYWDLHDLVKSRTTAWLAGAKTAIFSGNSDTLNATASYSYYMSSTRGIDYALIEEGFIPGYQGPVLHNASYRTYETDLKKVFKLMVDYNKKVMIQTKCFSTIMYDDTYKILNWTNYSGYIWYTDDIGTTIPIFYMHFLAGSYCAGISIGYGGNGLADSLASLTVGKIYTDQTTGRVYVWFTGNGDPTGKNVTIGGGDKLRHFGFALYYIFGRHNDNGFYAPFYLGWSYNIIPSETEWRAWHPSILYDVGQPKKEGINHARTVGNDLWGTSRTTSDYAYEFWRGDGTSSGTYWTSVWGTNLSSYHRVYARRLDKGYAFSRLRCSADDNITDGSYTQPVTFTLPFEFRVLNADKSFGPITTQFTIRQSEGVIIITDWGQKPGFVTGTGGGTVKIGSGGTIKP